MKLNKPVQPYPPNEFDYEKDFEEKVLCRILYVHEEVELECLVNNYFSEEVDPDEDDEIIRKKLNIRDWGYRNKVFTLKELQEMIPADVDPGMVEIKTNRSRHIEYIEVLVVQLIPVDKEAQKAAYKTAYDEYLKKKAQYEKEVKAYQKVARDLEIAACEKRLKTLKKGE